MKKPYNLCFATAALAIALVPVANAEPPDVPLPGGPDDDCSSGVRYSFDEGDPNQPVRQANTDGIDIYGISAGCAGAFIPPSIRDALPRTDFLSPEP